MLICCVCFTLQYSAVDSNPLSIYVMHPFWNFVVKVRKPLVSPCHSIPAVLWHVNTLLVTFWIFRVCFASPSEQFLPTWLAPNLITFTGFMFLVLNFVMLAFYDFDFNASGEFSSLLNGDLIAHSSKQSTVSLQPDRPQWLSHSAIKSKWRRSVKGDALQKNEAHAHWHS